MKKTINILFIVFVFTASSFAFQSQWGGPSKINVKEAEITTPEADTTPLTINGAADQSADLTQWKDSADNVVARVHNNGRFSSISGLKVDALKGGGSILAWAEGGVTVEHNISTEDGVFDLTGGTYANLFTDSTNSPFTSADKKNWIIIRSGAYEGAMAEIDQYIDASNVILHTMGWDFDLSGVAYYIVDHPKVVIGDGNHMEFNVGTGGHFDIHSVDWVGLAYTNYLFEAELESAADDLHAGLFKAEAHGYTGNAGLHVEYVSGDLAIGELGGGIRSRIDLSGAINADSTTKAAAFIATSVNGSQATKQAYVALSGFDEAFNVAGAEIAEMDYGYEITSFSVADRQAAYSSLGVNVQLFDNDNDYILIGDDNTFEIIDISLATTANRKINAVYEYSTGNGTWAALTVSDATNEFKSSGQILFDAPGGWAVGSEAEVPGDITNAYYVKITRTRNSLATPPTESTIKIFADKDIGMKITGQGLIQPAFSTDGSAPNNSIYYSTDQSKLVYKDSGGSVNDLY